MILLRRDLGNVYTTCKLPLIKAIKQLDGYCPLPPMSTGTSGGQYCYLMYFHQTFFLQNSTEYKFNLFNGLHLRNTAYFYVAK